MAVLILTLESSSVSESEIRESSPSLPPSSATYLVRARVKHRARVGVRVRAGTRVRVRVRASGSSATYFCCCSATLASDSIFTRSALTRPLFLPVRLATWYGAGVGADCKGLTVRVEFPGFGLGLYDRVVGAIGAWGLRAAGGSSLAECVRRALLARILRRRRCHRALLSGLLRGGEFGLHHG